MEQWQSKNQKQEDKTQNKNKHQIIFEIQSKSNTNNYIFTHGPKENMESMSDEEYDESGSFSK